MPGLAGCLKRECDVNVEDVLREMVQEMMHDNYSTDMFVTGPVGIARISLGILNPEPQPLVMGETVIFMDGELYDHRLKEDLVNKGHTFPVGNDPEYVIHLYSEYGRDFVHHLNGSCVIVLWNGRNQELTIVNDRYGLRPFYYTERDGCLLFGSEMGALLGKSIKPAVDERALSDFLLFRCILGTKTIVRGISLLPPASIMTCTCGGISVESYWDFDFHESEAPEPFLIEKLSFLLTQATERQLKGVRIGASLTGGFDTRMIVSLIVRKIPHLHTYTWGGPGCKDTIIAPIIAKNLGTHHHLFMYEPHHFAREGTYLMEGVVDPDTFGVLDRLKEIRTFLDIEVGGIGGGEILRGNCITKQMEASESEEELFEAVLDYLSIDIPEGLLTELYYPRIEESRRYLESLFQKYTDEPLLNKSDHVFIREILPSYVRSNFFVKNSQFEYRTPFFDNDLVDFAQTIPVSLRKDSSLLIKVLLGISPQMAAISFEAAGCPVCAAQSQGMIQRLKDFLKRVRQYLFKTEVRNFRLVDYTQWMQENIEVQTYIREILLSQKAKSRGYFEMETVQKILEDQFTGKKDNWKLISRLIIFELWCRTLIDREGYCGTQNR